MLPGRRVLISFLVVSLAMTVRLAIPGPVAACSCAMAEDPMAESAADPTVTVFTGIAQVSGPGGVPVLLTRLLEGTAPGPILMLDPAGFEDPFGGMCGTAAPTPGTEWIFVTAMNEGGRYDVQMCTPHAALGTQAGQALLVQATAAFGPGRARAPLEPGAPAEPTGVPAWVLVLGGLGTVIFGTSVLLGIALVARRREEPDR
jgi:hypothetical protein